jgi:organic radical activating enzyme
MFGKNEIVGRAYFKDAPENTLLVTSMFMTLQGEGPFRGEPAFFIRLAKCNLACGFCDTFFDQGDEITFSEISNKITETIENYYMGQPPKWAIRRKMPLVITGGEPLLQPNLTEFCHTVGYSFRDVQIESNGTQPPGDLPAGTVLVVSPKCVEKKGVALRYLMPREDILDRADCLKFVMCADENSAYSQIPIWAHDWIAVKRKPVYISPMNIYNETPKKAKNADIDTRAKVDEVISFWEPGLLNMRENQANHEYAARYCVQHGLILNLQIQLYASLA